MHVKADRILFKTTYLPDYLKSNMIEMSTHSPVMTVPWSSLRITKSTPIVFYASIIQHMIFDVCNILLILKPPNKILCFWLTMTKPSQIHILSGMPASLEYFRPRLYILDLNPVTLTSIKWNASGFAG